MSQTARSTALRRFRDREVSVLVATDVASRGLDVDGVTHVVNYSLGPVHGSVRHSRQSTEKHV